MSSFKDNAAYLAMYLYFSQIRSNLMVAVPDCSDAPAFRTGGWKAAASAKWLEED